MLQERADRIREREARRKANLKKKEERNEKEREARQRMNLPSPKKSGFHVGPSQLHLGDFMVMGGKRKREEAPSIYGNVENKGLMDAESKSCQVSNGAPPSRTPLREASANMMTKVEPCKEIEDSERPEQDIKGRQEMPTKSMPPTHSRNSPELYSTKPIALPLPLAKVEASEIKGEDTKAIKPDKASPMGPPPLPNPVKTKPAPLTTHQTRALLPPQSNPPTIPPDPWDDIFVSNTQIIREISLPALAQAPKPSAPTKPLFSPSLPSKNKDETPSLLPHLSTQDLDTSDIILTQRLIDSPPTADTTNIKTPPAAAFATTTISSLLQISTQDLDFSSPFSPSPSKSQSQRKGAPSSEYNEDVTEEDLEDLVLEYEMGSSWRPKGDEKMIAEAEAEEKGEGEGEGNGEEVYEFEEEEEAFDSELSTQDWRELGVACECTG